MAILVGVIIDTVHVGVAQNLTLPLEQVSSHYSLAVLRERQVFINSVGMYRIVCIVGHFLCEDHPSHNGFSRLCA